MALRVLLLTLTLLNFSKYGFSQKECTVESLYENPANFFIDTIYNNVNVDGQFCTFKFVYDKQDANLELIEEMDEYAFSSPSPMTMLIYNEKDKLIYAEKFGLSLPRLYKANGELQNEGKLYLGWFSSGGGSGYSVKTSFLSYENDKFRFNDFMESNELTYTVFNKNDQEIYLLQGIWDMSGDIDSEDWESHFAPHRYEIIRFKFMNGDFEVKSLGTTKNKYDSEVENDKELLREITTKERILTSEIDLNNFY